MKAALCLGLALICVTWVSAGYYFTRRMAELQSRATAIDERYMRGQELLTTVRSQVLVGSVYVRDALLDPDRNSADEYRLKLEEAYQTADQALLQYEPVLNLPAERDQVRRLRSDIGDFRTTVLNVLATDSSRWPIEARTLLRREIMPKREGVIRVTDEVHSTAAGSFSSKTSSRDLPPHTAQAVGELWSGCARQHGHRCPGIRVRGSAGRSHSTPADHRR